MTSSCPGGFQQALGNLPPHRRQPPIRRQAGPIQKAGSSLFVCGWFPPVSSGVVEDTAGDTPAQLAEKAARRAKFIRKLIPADFVEDLRADRDAIDGKNAAATADNLEGLESTEEIEALLLQGGKEVTALDAMMHNLYSRNPAKLHAWLAASRVERSPKRKKTPDAPVTPPSPQG